MSYLKLSNVSKSFSNRNGVTEVLHDVNLEMERGEFVAIVGFSGSGKSTLINLVAGLIKPDRGNIKLDGEVITGPGPDRMQVFQNYSLLPWLTAFENVKLAVDQVFPQWEKDWRIKHTEQYLNMVNLGHAMDRKPSQLSGGMRQRVSVARALACEPRVMLLDEPFGALDALTRATLQDEILRIRDKDDRTVLMITNDVDEAILLADRIIPLTMGPKATLGESIPVTIARPRDRKAMNHDEQFKKLRKEVTDFLLGSSAAKRKAKAATISKSSASTTSTSTEYSKSMESVA
jgi:nitrate/nitrite transport system ATP-binding protein